MAQPQPVYAYIAVTPHPTYFNPLESVGQTYPTDDYQLVNVPQPPGNQMVSQTYCIKFGDHGAQAYPNTHGSYKRSNPSLLFFIIKINDASTQMANIGYQAGKFFEEGLINQCDGPTINNFNHGRLPNRVFIHVTHGNEWYYSWNARQELRDMSNLLNSARNASDNLLDSTIQLQNALITLQPIVQPQQQLQQGATLATLLNAINQYQQQHPPQQQHANFAAALQSAQAATANLPTDTRDHLINVAKLNQKLWDVIRGFVGNNNQINWPRWTAIRGNQTGTQVQVTARDGHAVTQTNNFRNALANWYQQLTAWAQPIVQLENQLQGQLTAQQRDQIRGQIQVRLGQFAGPVMVQVSSERRPNSTESYAILEFTNPMAASLFFSQYIRTTS